MQASKREVSRDHDRCDRAADRLAQARDDVEYPRHCDQLPRENRQRAKPKQQRHHAADTSVVTKLKIVADGVEIVFLRDAPYLWPDREREYHRADSRRADPPPRRYPIAIT